MSGAEGQGELPNKPEVAAPSKAAALVGSARVARGHLGFLIDALIACSLLTAVLCLKPESLTGDHGKR